MTIFLIMLVQALPVYIVARVFKSGTFVTLSAIIMAVLAIATGRSAYTAIDLFGIGVAYWIGLMHVAKSEPPKRSLPEQANDAPQDREDGLPSKDDLPLYMPRMEIVRDIATAAKKIAETEGRSQTEGEFLAIVRKLDVYKSWGSSAAKIIVEVTRVEYAQHFNDVMMYLGWRDKMLILKPEVERRLMRRLEKVVDFGDQIRQTLQLVEGLDLVERAHALLWVGVCLRQSLQDSWQYGYAFHNPTEVPREALLKLYYPLLELRDIVKMQSEQTLKTEMASLVLGDDGKKHMAGSVHGWEIILATMASGLVSNRNNDGREIWHCLGQAHGELVIAMDRFRRCINRMGAADFPFSDEECVQNAKTMPDQFTRPSTEPGVDS